MICTARCSSLSVAAICIAKSTESLIDEKSATWFRRRCTVVTFSMARFALFLLLCAAAVSVRSAPTLSLNASVTDANNGDVIYLEPTVYSGADNCNIQIQAKQLTLVSRTSEAVIDCEGQSRCVVVSGGSSVTIVGVTLRNGNAVENQQTMRSKHLVTKLTVFMDFLIY